MQMGLGCRFLHDLQDHEFVYGNENIQIVYDTYPIGKLHFLVIPKQHVLSAAMYTECSELFRCIKELGECLRETGLSYVIYEHGNVSENATSNLSIDHAHVHVVVCENLQLVFEKFTRDLRSYIEIRSFAEGITNISLSTPYHILCDSAGKGVYTYDSLPSQYFRKVIASVSGDTVWDWKANPRWFENYKEQYASMRRKYACLVKEKMS